MKPIQENRRNRLKVFLDSNIILAGIGSETGASGTVLDLCEAELVVPVISKQVVVLVEKLRGFLGGLHPIMIEDPPVEEVRKAGKQVHEKDAPILAAAKVANVDYLVTLDKKHFLNARQEVEFVPPVLTPGELLRVFEKWSQERI